MTIVPVAHPHPLKAGGARHKVLERRESAEQLPPDACELVPVQSPRQPLPVARNVRGGLRVRHEPRDLFGEIGEIVGDRYEVGPGHQQPCRCEVVGAG